MDEVTSNNPFSTLLDYKKEQLNTWTLIIFQKVLVSECFVLNVGNNDCRAGRPTGQDPRAERGDGGIQSSAGGARRAETAS